MPDPDTRNQETSGRQAPPAAADEAGSEEALARALEDLRKSLRDMEMRADLEIDRLCKKRGLFGFTTSTG
jgi:hypothetical protein